MIIIGHCRCARDWVIRKAIKQKKPDHFLEWYRKRVSNIGKLRDGRQYFPNSAGRGNVTLDSDLGLAMNYANLGSIFEMRGMMDSAFVYYNYSMEHNRAAGSVVGISLCHNHIGRLFEKKGQWDQAIREYRNAYDLMVADNDLYHWLESCLALARVNIYKGDLRMAEAFLEHAEGAAKVPRAWKHLSSVYHLDYLRYKKLGDYKNALNAYTSSLAYADSMRNTENMNHIQNLRVDYEKERSNRKLSLIQKNYEMGQRTKNIFLIACLIVLFLTVVAMGFLWYALRMKSRNQQVMRRMEEVRANFFTNVTHEFRTPLTVILGVSEELRKGGIGEEELKTGLNMIGRQGKEPAGIGEPIIGSGESEI